MVLFVALATLSPADGVAGRLPLPSRSEGAVTPLRELARPATASRLYTTGDTLTIYSENLESFSSPGSEGGWTHIDKSGQPTAWHIAPDFACEGNGFWCGVFNAAWT